MSSAEDSPQSSYTKTKYRIRWRLVLLGFCLIAFGLALPFALDAYYSSAYSQISDSEPVPVKRPAANLSFKKQRSQDEQLSQPYSFEKASHIVSTDPAQTPLELRLSSRVVGVGQCPGERISINCRVIVSASGGRPPYKYDTFGWGSVNGQGNSRAVWNLSGVPPNGIYSIIVNGDEKTKKNVKVRQCSCITPKPTPTPTITHTPTPTPLPTQTPDSETPTPTATTSPLPTPSSSATLSPTPTANIPPADSNVPSNGVNGNVKTNTDADKFGFTYPSRFIKGTVYTVCLSLQPGESSLKLCENPDDDIPTTSGGATVQPVERPGFDSFVTADLRAISGVEIVENPEELRLPYSRDAGNFPTWKWKLKLTEAGENSGEVKIQFNCDVEWVSKKDSTKVEKKEKYWTSEELESRTGLPILSKIITFLSSLGGGMAFIFGVAPGLGGKKIGLTAPPETPHPGALYPPSGGAASKVDWGDVSGAGGLGMGAQKESLEDEVDCTLYAPPAARAGTSFVIQVFAHLAEQAEGLYDIAKALDEETKKQAAGKLKKKIARGSMLTFKLTMPGLDVAETEESGDWDGEPLDIQFIVSVPGDHTSGNRFGKVSVYENEKKIGTIAFRIEILARSQEIAQPAVPALVTTPMTRHESAFISYASEDKAEVYDFLRLLDGFGVTYHVDIFDIPAGERWEQKLYEFIDSDDLFLLFWSKAASRSEWVLKEAERANSKTGKERKNPPKIVIYQLETPPEAKIPDWLKDIQYDRKWTQISERARRQK